MWIIEGKDRKHHLLPEKSYTLGRKDCDLVIPGDPAISRKHATFITSAVRKEEHIAIPRSRLQLEDLSKFGTFVNGTKMTTGEKVDLKQGDQVKFGSDKSSFRVVHEDLVVTTSCLDTAMKRSVKTLLRQLGGCLLSEWSKHCNMVVMGKLTVTAKVISALITNKPIVTPDYLQKLHKSIENNTDTPDPQLFLPSLVESQLNPEEVSFEADPKRKTIFQGHKFIFLVSKQFSKLSPVIELGGGVTVLMEKGTRADEAVLVEDRSLVMYSDHGDSQESQHTQTTQSWISTVLSVLKRHNKRPIPEAELGYAVLYCSTDKFCNPAIIPQADHYPSMAPPSLSQAPPSLSEVLPEAVEPPQQPSSSTVVKGSEKSAANVGTDRSTALESDTRVDNIIEQNEASSRDSDSRKRQRNDSQTSPSLPPPKQVKQSASPAPVKGHQRSSHLPVIKQTTSPVTKKTANNTTTTTPAQSLSVKQEPVSQSLDLFASVNPSVASRHKMTCEVQSIDDIFGEESEINATAKTDKSRDIFAPSPVIEPARRGPPGPVDDFDAVPSTNRRRNRQSAPNTSTSHDSSTQSHRQGRSGVEELDEFDAVPSARKRKRATQSTQHQQQLEKVKVVETEDTVQLLDTIPTAEVRDRKPAIADSQAGEFLTAKKAPENHGSKLASERSESNQSEEMDRNKCQVSAVSLIRKKPRIVSEQGQCNMWKGKSVKNFKKFRKAGSQTTDGGQEVVTLPRIIGGSDLLPHRTLAQRNLMAKFAKELQDESSEHLAHERDIDAMFELIPSKKTTVRRR